MRLLGSILARTNVALVPIDVAEAYTRKTYTEN